MINLWALMSLQIAQANSTTLPYMKISTKFRTPEKEPEKFRIHLKTSAKITQDF